MSVYNPKGDGHCGFRALAVGLGKSEDNYQDIKMQMLQYYISRKHFYVDDLGYDHDQLISVLQDCSDRPPMSNWFVVPDCAQLAADAFAIPIAFLDMAATEGQSCMYLPLGPLAISAVPIGLSLENGGTPNAHFKYVKFNTNGHFPWPRLNPQHEPIRRKFGFVDISHIYSKPSYASR
jgi:hypothetical protein